MAPSRSGRSAQTGGAGHRLIAEGRLLPRTARCLDVREACRSMARASRLLAAAAEGRGGEVAEDVEDVGAGAGRVVEEAEGGRDGPIRAIAEAVAVVPVAVVVGEEGDRGEQAAVGRGRRRPARLAQGAGVAELVEEAPDLRRGDERGLEGAGGGAAGAARRGARAAGPVGGEDDAVVVDDDDLRRLRPGAAGPAA